MVKNLPVNAGDTRDTIILSHVQLFVTPWTAAHQAPLSMELFRQEDWSGLPFPSPGDLSNPGIELRSPALQADSLPTELWGYCIYSIQLTSVTEFTTML